MKNLKEFKPLLKYLKEDKIKLIIASVLLFVASFSSIISGYLNGIAVEFTTKGNFKAAILALSIYFLSEIILGGIINHMGSAMLQKLESRLTRKLGFFTYKKVLELPAEAFEKQSSGEIINRITNDADSLSFTFGRLLDVVFWLIGSLFILIYIFINSWIVGLEIIIFAVILFFVINKYNPMIKENHKERKNAQDKFTSIVTESVRGIREIKTLGIKRSLINDAISIIKDIYSASKKEISMSKKFHIITTFLKSSLEIGTFITCIILICNHKVSLAFFISMTYYIYRYMWLIENINELNQTYQRVVVSLGRVNELLENKLYNDESFGDIELKNTKGVIEFKNVVFSYPGEDKTLDGFNLKIEPNKKIAIVGESGQGKSTLFNLITRVFNPDEGEITIDGINIKDLTEESLRNNISVIRQEPFIFNRTIKENFKLIDEKISLKTIRKYTSMAFLDDYIMSLPKKYNTLLGEGGVNLSGGQKQRLAIARTLSRDSKVILFDEATSALDNNSQGFIKRAIDDLVKDHTVIIIAHRLSTIMDADIINVVEKGKVVASGTHEELMKNCKNYRKLYETESLNS